MRILVTGKDGQVGRELLQESRRGRGLSGVHWSFAGRDECDFADAPSIRRLIRRANPGVIVNAAAYTAVDRAESDRDACIAVNAAAPGILAEEAAQIGAILIHYSTDYVFDGEKREPYVETDEIHPLNVYGASKAAGEAAIAAVGGRYLILRTSWVYGAHGKNFLLTMLRLAAERMRLGDPAQDLRVVDDQTGAPTSARAIAAATVRLIGQDRLGPSGIYNMSASGSTTWCGFARAIFAAGEAEAPGIIGIPTSEYPLPARRPRNSILCNDKFDRAFGFRLPPWQRQMEEVLAEISAGRRIERSIP